MAGDGEADDEHAKRLFREAMRDVRRLDHASHDRVTAPRRRPAAPGRRRDQHTFAPTDEDKHLDPLLGHNPLPAVGRGEPLEYRASGVALSTVRQLRRGHFRVEGAVDLHGLNAPRATAVLRDFMAEARAERARCVKVVHGKGIGSGDRGPVLKTLANSWLRAQDDVLAFVSAPAEDGGTGALYVLLRRAR